MPGYQKYNETPDEPNKKEEDEYNLSLVRRHHMIASNHFTDCQLYPSMTHKTFMRHKAMDQSNYGVH